jgi:hypothetical protein
MELSSAACYKHEAVILGKFLNVDEAARRGGQGIIVVVAEGQSYQVGLEPIA